MCLLRNATQSSFTMDLLLKSLYTKSEIDNVIRNTEDKVRMRYES